MKLHVQRTSLALTGSLVLLIGFAGLVTPSAYAATQSVDCNGDTTDDVARPQTPKRLRMLSTPCWPLRTRSTY